MRRLVLTFCVLIVTSAVGCRGGWRMPFAAAPAPATAVVQQPAATTITDKTEPVTDRTEPAPQTDEEALAAVLDELSAIDAIDAEAKQVLMADLKQAKPENWPLIVQQFKSALAYRQQLAAREQAEPTDAPALSPGTTPTTTLVAAKQSPPAVAVADVSTPQPPVTYSSEPQSTSLEPQLTATSDSSQQVTTIYPNLTDDAQRPTLQPRIVDATPPMHAAQQVNYLRTDAPSHDWQAHLQDAIDDFGAKVQPTPGSTDEVNQHMRLRLLELLAGNVEAALAPIPGATAIQQDYWNKQLFALSTFLDADSQPDDKRRASGSLVHLDSARAKLAELATLQVENLAFVDSVEGYGAYEPREQTAFQPGDKVMLYCEIENFGSESTREGYRTRLGTSYEVVDKNGKRVDSAQFPEIEDLCRNARRDFHMQYTVTLPSRIYPDEYELRLIITDQQSHKIGQASVPFEIAE